MHRHPIYGKTPEQEDLERKQSEIIKEREKRIWQAKKAIADINAEHAPKFEYYRLRTGVDNRKWTLMDFNRNYSELDALIDELGDRGWELVGISTKVESPASGMTYTYREDFIFKRPKAAIPEELSRALEAAKAYNGE